MIEVIIGNPPYSVGQKNENDNAKNLKYDTLDDRIRSTYVDQSTATNKNSLYDSYIRAIRWASDRITGDGVVGFITNGSWLRGIASDGIRKCFKEEFHSIYIYDLKGDQRTSGERSRQEGGKIFGASSRCPIAIVFFIKNKQKSKACQIFYYSVQDYMTRKQKLDEITSFDNLFDIPWKNLAPDKYHDWLDQRDQSFESFVKIGAKKSTEFSLWENRYSGGLKTCRDAWVTSASKTLVQNNIRRMIICFNNEMQRYQQQQDRTEIDDFVISDGKKIKWDITLKKNLARNKKITYSPDATILSSYRLFEKRWLYYSRELNNSIYQMPQIFPLDDSEAKNLIIATSGKGCQNGFSALMSDSVIDSGFSGTSQCYPLFWYQNGKKEYAMQEKTLQMIRSFYDVKSISYEDVFYYIYGLFHHPGYTRRYHSNLTKELPRIPFPKDLDIFKEISKSGKKLGDLHLNYDNQDPWDCKIEFKSKDPDFRVKKMRYPIKKRIKDLSKIIYNDDILISDIPIRCHDYKIDGRSALSWVVQRQMVKRNKESGILYDPNDYAIETMKDPRYPYKLLLSVITMSMKTLDIMENLPHFDLDNSMKVKNFKEKTNGS